MEPIQNFTNSQIKVVFTDIDDTLTTEGRLDEESYSAIWKLYNNGIKVVPVTGRPAGWCELIARQWPVAGVIGENGGFYFCYENKTMKRKYVYPEKAREDNLQRLNKVKEEILSSIPGAQVASDQFCRAMDLAIDFCEDVKPLPMSDVQRIVDIFKKHGAMAKVSSIHVNGWFGDYDKLSMCKIFSQEILGLDIEAQQDQVAFVGDSPNDESMFSFFNNAFAVKNFEKFKDQVKALPKYIANLDGGKGFAEITEQILIK